MSAPGQQPNDSAQQTGEDGVAPGGGSSGPVVSGGTAPASPQPAMRPQSPQPQPQPQPQPEPRYGQYAHLDYGAMRSQYGPNYDPYLYGAPDPEPKKDDAAQGRVPASAPAADQGRPPYGVGSGANGGYGTGPRYGAGADMSGDGRPHRIINGIDVDDPDQNPLYGKWDFYAIIAFVFALFFGIPLLPAIMGASSIWRTRTFHMKGQGFAIAAVVINLLVSAVYLWMWVNGMDVNDLLNWALGMIGGSAGPVGPSGSGGAMSA